MVSAVIKSRMKICQLVAAYVSSSREHSLKSYFRDGLEDPFDDIGAVKQLMEQFATLCRCDYPQTAKELMSYFDTHMNLLFNAASTPRVRFA